MASLQMNALQLLRVVPKPDVNITRMILCVESCSNGGLNIRLAEQTVLYLDYIVRILINARQRPLRSLLKCAASLVQVLAVLTSSIQLCRTLGPGGDALLGLAGLDPNLTPTTMTPVCTVTCTCRPAH